MDELELTIMTRNEESHAVLRDLIAAFEVQQRQKTAMQVLDWTRGRSELVKVALYHHGGDLSEIGTTWINDLVAMNALRPFSAAEVERLGPPDAFLEPAWKSTKMAGDPQVWSIPWLAEALVLHYRKDLLAAAGIDEARAFQSLEQLYETVQRLKEHGHALPIAIASRSNAILLLHTAATWLWQAGGDFLEPGGRQVAFNQSQALRGLTSFFHLLRSIPPDGIRILEQYDIAGSFRGGLAPLAVSAAWLRPEPGLSIPFSVDDWGVTRLPGPPFVGGSNLVIWKHTRQEEQAIRLVEYLTSESVSNLYAQASGILPARANLSVTNDRFRDTVYQSIQNGQTFPTVPLWGLVEDRLTTTLGAIWNSLYDYPETEVEEIVPRVLNQLARSLNLTLSQR